MCSLLVQVLVTQVAANELVYSSMCFLSELSCGELAIHVTSAFKRHRHWSVRWEKGTLGFLLCDYEA